MEHAFSWLQMNSPSAALRQKLVKHESEVRGEMEERSRVAEEKIMRLQKLLVSKEEQLETQQVAALAHYTPCTTKLLGVYWFHSVCLSVRPASRVRSVAPTVLVGSISYLYILSSNFRRCVACKVSCKISKFGGGYLRTQAFLLF